MVEPELQDITFRSKIGVWLIVTMAVPLLVVWFAFSVTKRPGIGVLASCLPLCGVEGLFLWMLIKTSYRFSGGRLSIKSTEYEIDLAISEILAVTPSHDPTRSPAVSPARIEIEYTHQGRKASVLISPKRLDLFIKELQRRDSGLKLVQNRLIREPLIRLLD
jgi:hypothetical protein